MLRCFPCPPQGYMSDGARVETVFESIKERENTITKCSKEKSGEKNERKMGKKEYKVDKFHQGKKSLLPKEIKEEAEKSDLTDEHEQPVSSQTVWYLSDGTQRNRKRKWDYLASNDGRSRGTIICIRLPLRNDRDPDLSLSGEQLCSTSGRVDSLCQQNEIVRMPGQEQCSSINSKTGTIVGEPTPKPVKIPCSSDSERKKSFGYHDTENSSKISIYEKKRQTIESLYKALIEDWDRPTLQFEQDDFGDQEWLFGMKKQGRDGYRKSEAYHVVSCLRRSNLGPHAHHLPEADVYALPYTIPF